MVGAVSYEEHLSVKLKLPGSAVIFLMHYISLFKEDGLQEIGFSL